MPTASLFVSSVQKELAEERRAIRDFVGGDALLSRFFRVFLFEELPASDRRADEVYLDAVDRAAAGLPEPEFVQDGGLFVQRLRRPKPVGKGRGFVDGPESRPESRPESSAAWWRGLPVWQHEWDKRSVHDRIMVAVQARPLTRAALATALSHKGVSSSLKKAMNDLMKVGLLAYTLPEKPGSRLQRYRAVRPERK